jgi:coproporphyrinogen III oxidase
LKQKTTHTRRQTDQVEELFLEGEMLVSEDSKMHESSPMSPQKEAKGSMQSPIGKEMASFVQDMQSRIVARLEAIETDASGGKEVKFLRDAWTRDEGGHGLSCVLQQGRVFEKGGVNVSIIQSPCPQPMLNQMRARLSSIELKESVKYDMFVAGISMVLHPHNPHAPTVHLNYR